MRRRTLDVLRNLYLVAIYQLAQGEAYKFVDVNRIRKQLEITEAEFNALRASFIDSSLLIHTVVSGKVKMTAEGLREAERIMERTYAEEELMVLEKVAELARKEPNGYVMLDALQRELPSLSMAVVEYVKELESKGFLGGGLDEATKVQPKGFEFLQKQSNRQGNISIYSSTINAGDNSNNVIGNNNQQSISQSVNPDFANTIQVLAELIKNSELSELQKEERLHELELINRLGEKEQTLEVKQLAISRLQLFEIALKVGDLAVKVAPHIDKLIAFFSN